MKLDMPCKVGDKVYVIDRDYEHDENMKVYEAEWETVGVRQIIKDGEWQIHGRVGYQIYDIFYNDGRTMPCGMYVGQHSTKVGRVVFLTKEEAEQKLIRIAKQRRVKQNDVPLGKAV